MNNILVIKNGKYIMISRNGKKMVITKDNQSFDELNNLTKEEIKDWYINRN